LIRVTCLKREQNRLMKNGTNFSGLVQNKTIFINHTSKGHTCSLRKNSDQNVKCSFVGFMEFLVGYYMPQTKVQCSANGYYMPWYVLNNCLMVYVTRRGYWTWSNPVWICSTFQHVEVCPRTITSKTSNTTIVFILYTITAWCLFGWKTNFHKSLYRKTVLCWSNEIFLIIVCFFALCFGLTHAMT